MLLIFFPVSSLAFFASDSVFSRIVTVVDGLAMPDVKKISKDFMDGYFQVPKVIGDGA